MKIYTVCAAYTQADANSFDHCTVTQDFDSLREAKSFAKHSLTDEYRRSIEARDLLNYAKVECNGECLADYLRDGWESEDADDDLCDDDRVSLPYAAHGDDSTALAGI